MIDKTEPELKQREQRFCSYLALGYDQSDAYRRSYKAKRLTADVIANRASRLANEQRIIDRVALCVTELKLEQLDSLGKCYKDLIEGIELAKSAKNYNAMFAGMRLRLQCMGLLKENVHITSEQRMTDAQLVEQIGAKDPTIRDKLKVIMGSGDAFAA